MVTIPNGDYSSNKVIIAKLESDQIEPEFYTSQLDLMQIFTENILNTNKIDIHDNGELLANEGGGSSYKHLYTIYNEKRNLTGYNRMGIAAEFQSLLNNTDTVRGSYGLKFYISSTLPAIPGQAQKEGIYEFYLDAADMIGDPYTYSAFARQEKVIDISMVQNITKIDIYFYQNGDFKDSNNNLIDWQFVNDLAGLDMSNMPNNLLVRNIELFMGYEAGAYEEDRMVIHCDDYPSYSYLDYNQDTGIMKSKNLELKWLHKFEDSNENNSKYELVNMTSLSKMGITLKWFKYNLNSKRIDKYAGRNWEEIPLKSNNLFKCSFTPNKNNAQERVKVIGYKVNNTYESSEKLINNADYLNEWRQMMDDYNKKVKVPYGMISTKEEFKNIISEMDLFYYSNDQEFKATEQSYSADIQYYKLMYKNETVFNEAVEKAKLKYLGSIESVDLYESEEIILTNDIAVYDSVTFNASSSLSIYYEDGSEGNYFIYDSNGRILDQGKGQGYERRMRAVYNGKEITPELGNLDYIDWYLPVIDQSKTMILNTKAYFEKDKGQSPEDDHIDYQGVQYKRIRRFVDPETKLLNTWQSYSIGSNLNTSALNNLIRCEVSIDGTVYVASNTMRFGKQGTAGSNTTIVLEMVDNHNAITIPVPKDENGKDIQYTVVATAYDSQGDVVTISGEWEWDWKTPMVKVGKKPAIEIEPFSKYDPNKINLKINMTSLNDVSEGYYGILKATFKQVNSINLVAFLALPLKAPGYSHIEGAQEITYNSSGIPQYYSDAYKIFKEGHEDGIINNPYTEIMDVDWNVVHDINFYKLDGNGRPIINKESGEAEIASMSRDYVPKLTQLLRYNSHGILHTYQALRAAPMFASGYDEICVTCLSDLEEDYTFKLVGEIKENNYSGNYYYFKDKENNYILSDTYVPNTIYYQLEKKVLWIQPLLITNGVYDYSMLNEWDGTLTTDEGAGTVMSAIIGAGRKNEDNTFSGILLGDVQDTNDLTTNTYVLAAHPGEMTETDFYKNVYYIMVDGVPQRADYFDKNQTYYKIRSATGLYGFQDGQISFSLKDNGVATFGKAGRGQITIDGNDSTITSKNYKAAGNGMFLDLDDGQLIIKDNEVKRFVLQPQDPYLTINGISNNIPLVKIGATDCYIQSQGKSLSGLGSKLDLTQGTLDITGSGGNVCLSGKDIDPFFKVKTRDGATLIHMDIDEYYLQSAFFNEDSAIRKTDDDFKLELYREKQYIPIVLNPSFFVPDQLIIAGENRYYKQDASGNYVGVSTADNFDKNIQYYRKGNWNYTYGYSLKDKNLYAVEYDNAKNSYRTSTIVDIWETDSDGNFKYPIATEVYEYKEYYDGYELLGLISETEFNEESELYYYNEGQSQYYLATSYDSTKEYYRPIGELLYEPILLIDIIEQNLTEDTDVTLLLIERYFNNNLEPIMSESVPSGMKINLVDGRIEGYNLKLIGTKLSDEGKVVDRLVINTDDDTTPVRIGGGFQIDWDGTLSCTNVKTISNTGKIPSIPMSNGVYGARNVLPSIYIVDYNRVITDENGNIQYDEDGEPMHPVVLDIGVNNQFYGNAATASNADFASTANHASVADDVTGGEEYWNNIFDNHGNSRYVSKNDAKNAYGPLNPNKSLDERINVLENQGNSHQNSINGNISEINSIKNRIKSLEELNLEQKIGALIEQDESINNQITNLSQTNDSINNQLEDLNNRLTILENYNIASLIARIEALEQIINKEDTNLPENEV